MLLGRIAKSALGCMHLPIPYCYACKRGSDDPTLPPFQAQPNSYPARLLLENKVRLLMQASLCSFSFTHFCIHVLPLHDIDLPHAEWPHSRALPSATSPQLPIVLAQLLPAAPQALPFRGRWAQSHALEPSGFQPVEHNGQIARAWNVDNCSCLAGDHF
eukprot:1108068-Pelagomonas_calceolata.AAC.4